MTPSQVLVQPMVYVRQLECFRSFHKTSIERLLYARPILVNRKVCALSRKKEEKELRTNKNQEDNRAGVREWRVAGGG